MHNVVLDTNVVISSIINVGYSNKVLYQLIAPRKITLHISTPILDEYIKVLSRPKFTKFKNFKTNSDFILSNIYKVGRKFTPDIELDVIKDKSDNKFIELAVFSKANFIITGNTKHFTIKEYKDIKIISPKEYWENFGKK
ncbi:MAG: putative toxin-antitoxin system toxin component, PIN family [Cytophagales bacterium]|nr:putative toxin-antitoxin system toxin component, PIN family [Cytophagales bacterium]